MTRYRAERGCIVEDFGGTTMSPIIANLARRNVPARHAADLVRFVSTGCSLDQLEMVIRLMGGTPTGLTAIEIEEMKGVLHASATLAEGIGFANGRIVLRDHRLPETMRTALVGRPLGDLLDHPLLPLDAPIVEASQLGADMHVDLVERQFR